VGPTAITVASEIPFIEMAFISAAISKGCLVPLFPWFKRDEERGCIRSHRIIEQVVPVYRGVQLNFRNLL
jgi:hypothetical protein